MPRLIFFGFALCLFARRSLCLFLRALLGLELLAARLLFLGFALGFLFRALLGGELLTCVACGFLLCFVLGDNPRADLGF